MLRLTQTVTNCGLQQGLVEQLLQRVWDKGDIYKAKYEGVYCNILIADMHWLTESLGHCSSHLSVTKSRSCRHLVVLRVMTRTASLCNAV